MKTMIIVNDGLEECEALIVYDLLYRAGIDVKLVGFTDTVVSSHNVTFKSDLLITFLPSSSGFSFSWPRFLFFFSLPLLLCTS